eukprot:NODE_67_length_3559_cov_21.837892_g59_i0.p1 GENE.NODE_67_length_3559_cov_21.837892_g59_i0~~NODE_67_length_3559_cov_21.837892_g59_i0.p1  ORF type:complete len:1161 (-),score=180.66 NODE_67_length_3559_cov_21.837892_g59_i0:77-3388(-)
MRALAAPMVDNDAVQTILEERPLSINVSNSRGMTAFHFACSMLDNPEQQKAIIWMLLDGGANPYASDDSGSTPLSSTDPCFPATLQNILQVFTRYRLENEMDLSIETHPRKQISDAEFVCASQVWEDVVYVLGQAGADAPQSGPMIRLCHLPTLQSYPLSHGLIGVSSFCVACFEGSPGDGMGSSMVGDEWLLCNTGHLLHLTSGKRLRPMTAVAREDVLGLEALPAIHVAEKLPAAPLASVSTRSSSDGQRLAQAPYAAFLNGPLITAVTSAARHLLKMQTLNLASGELDPSAGRFNLVDDIVAVHSCGEATFAVFTVYESFLWKRDAEPVHIDLPFEGNVHWVAVGKTPDSLPGQSILIARCSEVLQLAMVSLHHGSFGKAKLLLLTSYDIRLSNEWCFAAVRPDGDGVVWLRSAPDSVTVCSYSLSASRCRTLERVVGLQSGYTPRPVLFSSDGGHLLRLHHDRKSLEVTDLRALELSRTKYVNVWFAGFPRWETRSLQHRRVTHMRLQAPKPEVTLVFTDIQGSTNLWGAVEGAMEVALSTHNQILRFHMANALGYEVKTEGDAFMVAFADPLDATNWCLICQIGLLTAPWPPAILECAEASMVPNVHSWQAHCEWMWRGLRVRMGIHTGEPRTSMDPITLRTDYFGSPVNLAARVEGQAHGGQILMSSATHHKIRALQIQHQGAKPLTCVRTTTVCIGTRRLKGILEPQVLYQILPDFLSMRSFGMRGHAADVSNSSVGFGLEEIHAPSTENANDASPSNCSSSRVTVVDEGSVRADAEQKSRSSRSVSVVGLSRKASRAGITSRRQSDGAGLAAVSFGPPTAEFSAPKASRLARSDSVRVDFLKIPGRVSPPLSDESLNAYAPVPSPPSFSLTVPQQGNEIPESAITLRRPSITLGMGPLSPAPALAPGPTPACFDRSPDVDFTEEAARGAVFGVTVPLPGDCCRRCGRPCHANLTDLLGDTSVHTWYRPRSPTLHQDPQHIPDVPKLLRELADPSLQIDRDSIILELKKMFSTFKLTTTYLESKAKRIAEAGNEVPAVQTFSGVPRPPSFLPPAPGRVYPRQPSAQSLQQRQSLQPPSRDAHGSGLPTRLPSISKR